MSRPFSCVKCYPLKFQFQRYWQAYHLQLKSLLWVRQRVPQLFNRSAMPSPSIVPKRACLFRRARTSCRPENDAVDLAHDERNSSATARTASQIDLEHPPQPPQPLHRAHRGAGRGLDDVHGALRRGRSSGDDVVAMFGIRSEYAVVAQQMDARARHQGGETRNDVHGCTNVAGGRMPRATKSNGSNSTWVVPSAHGHRTPRPAPSRRWPG